MRSREFLFYRNCNELWPAGTQGYGGGFTLAGRPVLGYYSLKRPRGCPMLTYKVVEIGTVTEDTLEEVLNEWSAKGWRFDGMQFAMREASRRPALAFVLFTRDEKEH